MGAVIREAETGASTHTVSFVGGSKGAAKVGPGGLLRVPEHADRVRVSGAGGINLPEVLQAN